MESDTISSPTCTHVQTKTCRLQEAAFEGLEAEHVKDDLHGSARWMFDRHLCFLHRLNTDAPVHVHTW